MNLYIGKACALCHQLTPTETMINTSLGKVCIKCDIQMTKTSNRTRISKTSKTPKKLIKPLK